MGSFDAYNVTNFLRSESNEDDVNQEGEDGEETLDQDQTHQGERQQSQKKEIIPPLDATRVGPIVKKVAPVKKSKAKPVKISSKKIDSAHSNKSPSSSKNWDRISSITKMGVGLLAGAAAGMYLLRTHGPNFSGIFPVQDTILSASQIQNFLPQNPTFFQPLCGLNFSANPTLDFYSNFDLNQHHSYQPISINELISKEGFMDPERIETDTQEKLPFNDKADSESKTLTKGHESENQASETSTKGLAWPSLFATTVLSTLVIGLAHFYRRAIGNTPTQDALQTNEANTLSDNNTQFQAELLILQDRTIGNTPAQDALQTNEANTLSDNNTQLQAELLIHQKSEQEIKNCQKILEQTLQTYLEKDFSGIKVEVKNGEDGTSIQTSVSNKTLGSETNALDLYIQATLNIIAPQITINTTLVSVKKEKDNIMVSIPIRADELRKIDENLKFFLENFIKINTLQAESLEDLNTILETLESPTSKIELKKEVNSWNPFGAHIGRAIYNENIWYFQNKEAFKSLGNPAEGISISYNKETKMLLLNSLPIQTEQEARLVQDFFNTFKSLSTQSIFTKVLDGINFFNENSSSIIEQKFDAINGILTENRNLFALEVAIKRKIEWLQNELEKSSISEKNKPTLIEKLPPGFEIKIEEGGFEIIYNDSELKIELHKDGHLLVNGFSDRSFKQAKYIYDFFNSVNFVYNEPEAGRNVLKMATNNLSQVFPITKLNLQPDDKERARTDKIQISLLKEGQKITKEELIDALEQFKKIAPNKYSKDRTYQLPLTYIVHKSNGLFCIQHELVFTQLGGEGSGIISIKDGELLIGNSNEYNQEQLNAAYSVLHALSTQDSRTIEEAFLLLKATNATRFDNINSSKLVDIPITVDDTSITENKKHPRNQFKTYYKQHPKARPPACVISTSDWIPKNRVAQDDGTTIAFSELLMKKKKKIALRKKWERGDQITNMEAAMHSFFVPLSIGVMPFDALWSGIVKTSRLAPNKGRPYILSTAIQPDLELDGVNAVILKLCQLGSNEVEGEELKPEYIFPSQSEKQDSKKREDHDLILQKHMISKLYSKSIKPAKEKVTIVKVDFLNEAIKKIGLADNGITLADKAIVVNEKTISLEAMFNFYKEQLACELLALEVQCPQGYIFTIDPPSFFVEAIGGSQNTGFLNRLQGLAMQQLIREGKIRNMKGIAFNNYADPSMINHYQEITKNSGIKVYRKVFNPQEPIIPGLFEPTGKCLIDPNDLSAIVLHNNSDGFGYNLANEAMTSLDGLIGCMSNFSSVYKKSREDLTRHVFTQSDWLKLRELRDTKKTIIQTEKDSNRSNGLAQKKKKAKKATGIENNNRNPLEIREKNKNSSSTEKSHKQVISSLPKTEKQIANPTKMLTDGNQLSRR